jgi:Ca2+-binding RTX toxin-like protein
MKRTITIALALGTALSVCAVAAWAENPVTCFPGPSCTGTSGPDQIQGTDEEDRINALGGADFVEPQGADDVVNGGPGEDFLSEFESDGSDTLIGGGAGDYLEGGVQGDVLRGGSGDEREQGPVRGAPFPSFRFVSMFGDEGNDRLSGGAGRDSMEGEQGRDVMKGGPDNDYLDAVNDDTDGTRDVVDCGKGFDRYSARAGDKVDDSCERKVPPGPEL